MLRQCPHEHDLGLLTQVLKNRRCLVKKQRQVVLNACGGDAGANVFVDAGFGRIAFNAFTPTVAEGAACRFIHRELAAWQQTHLWHRVQAALGVWVEGPNGVDLVAKQIHPIWHG